MDREQYLAGVRWLFDVATPGYTGEWLATRGERLALSRAVLRGAGSDVGPFESELLALLEVDDQGRYLHNVVFDVSDLAAAYAELEARYAAQSQRAASAALVPPNAATAAYDRFQAAFDARDWEAWRAVWAPHARIGDRRALVGVPMELEQLLAEQVRLAAQVDARYERRLLASFGARVDLEHVVIRWGPPGARSEVEMLHVTEVDAPGQILLQVAFDPGARRAAEREAFARLVASDPMAAAVLAPVSEVLEGYNDDDRARMRAALADDIAYEDHRSVGPGAIEGVDAFLDSRFPTLGLVQSTQAETVAVSAIERHGSVGVTRTFGTLADGGSFEILFAGMILVADGRITRFEQFEADRVDAALARLAELRPDPARIPPNAATRARNRWHEAVVAGDIGALEALFAPTLVFEDRSRRALVRGDRETLLANDRMVSASRPRGSPRVVGTAGDRLALHHLAITGSADGVEFEAEWLDLVEVDASGHIVAAIVFDLDDRAAAFAEAEARFAAGEAAAVGGQALFQSLNTALARRDWEALRACCAEELVVHDRRTLGLGSLPRDAWIESVAAATGIASDWSGESCRVLAFGRHGRVNVSRAFGTMPDGGGPFENLLVCILLTDGARIHQLEMFDIADADRALARFAELCSALP